MNTKKPDYNEQFKQKATDNCQLLLHVCCAPCLATAILKLKNLDVTCFFFNPNILPKEEFDRRLFAVKKLIDACIKGKLGPGYEKLKLVVPEQSSQQFFDAIAGKELLGEHSARCESCIDFRLKETCLYAKKFGFSHFATTLTSSPHKNATRINEIGANVGKGMYVPSDFKKESGALRSKEICDKLELFRQNYCGCNLPSNKLFSPFKIGNVVVPNRLILAPMAGYTDVGFRQVAKLCGAGLTCTEMVSAKALVFGNEKTDSLLATTDIESPKAVQIFGSDEESMCKAVALEALDKFDIIDINMGCPMPKIVKNGDGSALLDNVQKASNLVKKIVAVSKKPITVKFRKLESDEQTVAFAKAIANAGASAITIHGRTRKQLYAGTSDKNIVAKIAEAVDIPVIYSGDISNLEEAEQMLKLGATAVMIGRGSIGNPNIFGKPMSSKDAILQQIETDIKFLGERQTMLEIKKHLALYFKGQKNAAFLRKALIEAKSFDELKMILNELAID